MEDAQAIQERVERGPHNCHDPACRRGTRSARPVLARQRQTERARAVYGQRFEQTVDGLNPKTPEERAALLRAIRSVHFAELVKKRWAKRAQQQVVT